MTDQARPSDWQQRIEGEWYGSPAVFTPDGEHVGYEVVSRASEVRDGGTVYWMNTRLDGGGPLRARFELADQFEFGVRDSDEHRIYLGPDFYGAGEPFGSVVDAHYYSPAWQADLHTMVHVLADGKTQVYSSLLYDGPTICAVFNGVYTVAFDHDTNPETQARVAAWIEREREIGPRPHILPTKRAGVFRGDLEVYGPDQKPMGPASIEIRHEPIDLLRARQHVAITGTVEHAWTVERERQGNRHTFHGPGAWGNAMTYGRALYPSLHLADSSLKLKGREFLIDSDGPISLVWQFAEGELLRHLVYGELTWEPDA
jgi:hypothetical protein